MKSDLMVLKLHKADGPVYDNKQGNTEILYYLQNYYDLYSHFKMSKWMYVMSFQSYKRTLRPLFLL